MPCHVWVCNGNRELKFAGWEFFMFPANFELPNLRFRIGAIRHSYPYTAFIVADKDTRRTSTHVLVPSLPLIFYRDEFIQTSTTSPTFQEENANVGDPAIYIMKKIQQRTTSTIYTRHVIDVEAILVCIRQIYQLCAGRHSASVCIYVSVCVCVCVCACVMYRYEASTSLTNKLAIQFSGLLPRLCIRYDSISQMCLSYTTRCPTF